MSQFELFLGVDVSKESYEIAFLPTDNSQCASWKDIPSEYFQINREDFARLEDRIRDWTTPGKTYAAIDHTGGYFVAPLVQLFARLGCSSFFVSANSAKLLRTQLFVSDLKTDKIDARVLAYAAYLYNTLRIPIHPVRADNEAGRPEFTLLQMYLLRQQLVREKVQVTNRLRQLLAASFPEANLRFPTAVLKVVSRYPLPADILCGPELPAVHLQRATRQGMLELAHDTVGVSSPHLRESILIWSEFRDSLSARIENVENRLAEIVPQHPYANVLLSFPRIGVVRCSGIIGLIGDINRWPDSSKLKKMFGFYGVVEQSGQKSRMKRGRGGNRIGKVIVLQTVMAMIQKSAGPNDIRDHYLRHRARGVKSLKAAYKAGSKLIDLMYYCIKNEQTYEYQGSKASANPVGNPSDKVGQSPLVTPNQDDLEMASR